MHVHCYPVVLDGSRSVDILVCSCCFDVACGGVVWFFEVLLVYFCGFDVCVAGLLPVLADLVLRCGLQYELHGVLVLAAAAEQSHDGRLGELLLGLLHHLVGAGVGLVGRLEALTALALLAIVLAAARGGRGLGRLGLGHGGGRVSGKGKGREVECRKGREGVYAGGESANNGVVNKRQRRRWAA